MEQQPSQLLMTKVIKNRLAQAVVHRLRRTGCSTVSACRGFRIDIAKPINYDYSGGMAYSRDFRRKVLAVRNKEGLTIAEAAARFDVGSASVVRWSKNVERKPQGYRRRKIDLEALRKDVIDYPDAYQHERAQRFGVAQNAIFFALKKLQLTYKKNASSPQGGRRRTVHLPR